MLCPVCADEDLTVPMVQEEGDFVYSVTSAILSGDGPGIEVVREDDVGTCEIFHCPECGTHLDRMTSYATGDVELLY